MATDGKGIWIVWSAYFLRTNENTMDSACTVQCLGPGCSAANGRDPKLKRGRVSWLSAQAAGVVVEGLVKRSGSWHGWRVVAAFGLVVARRPTKREQIMWVAHIMIHAFLILLYASCIEYYTEYHMTHINSLLHYTCYPNNALCNAFFGAVCVLARCGGQRELNHQRHSIYIDHKAYNLHS